MKKTITILMVFCFMIGYAQEQKIAYSSVSKVSSISYKVTSIKELKAIDWNDINEIFNDNKEDEMISLAFEIDLPDSKNKINTSFKVQGEKKNLLLLVKKAKKGVNTIIRLTTTLNKQ